MAKQEPAGETIARNLQEAIERLQEDIANVQLWASALGSFSQPIPDYRPDSDFTLPQAKSGGGYEPLPPAERLYR
jgi:hypothetical protein